MGSFHLLMHAHWGHQPTRKRTPSPSPTRLGEASGVARVGWERVAAGRVRVRFMGRTDLQLLDAHWDHEPNPISRSSRGNEALIFFPESASGKSEPPDVGCYLRVGSWGASF